MRNARPLVSPDLPWFSPGRTRLRQLRSASACSRQRSPSGCTPVPLSAVEVPEDMLRLHDCVRSASRCKGPRTGTGLHTMTFHAEVGHSTAEDNLIVSDEEEPDAEKKRPLERQHSFFQGNSQLLDDDEGDLSSDSSISGGGEGAPTEYRGVSGERHSKADTDGLGKPPNRRMCSDTHSVFLRDKVYTSRCAEMRVNSNTGVKNLLIQSTPCFCWLQVVSFRDLLLGDRGILGVLTLFQFSHVLRSLNFTGNGLRESGVSSLLTLLNEPGRLKHLLILDLSHNPVGPASVEGLGQLLASRRQLALLGLHGTALPGPKRQLLLRRSRASFEAADPKHMLQAWRLGRDYSNFSDRDLWVTCTPAAEARFGRRLYAGDEDEDSSGLGESGSSRDSLEYDSFGDDAAAPPAAPAMERHVGFSNFG